MFRMVESLLVPSSVMMIDPTNFEQREELLALLKAQRGRRLNSDVEYIITIVDNHTKKSRKQRVKLTHTLIPYQRKDRDGQPVNETRYAIVDKTILGQGKEGEVRASDYTLELLDNDYLIKSKRVKPRIVKTYSLDGRRSFSGTRENTLMRIASDIFHPKNVNDKEAICISRRFNGVSMERFMEEEQFNYLSRTLDEIMTIIRNTIIALQEFHSKSLIHRDIKEQNLMIDPKTLEVRIIDLGLSVELNTYDGMKCGTPIYAAPEVYKADHVPQSDIFALGITAWHLLSGYEVPPSIYRDVFRGEFDDEKNAIPTARIINQERFGKIDRKVQNACAELVRMMMKCDPTKRASLQACLEHIHTIILAPVQHKAAESESSPAAAARVC